MISGIIKVEVSVIRLRLITLRDLDYSGYYKPREVWIQHNAKILKLIGS